MKILHVVPTYIPAWRYGGPIRSVHGLCKALVAQGHEVHVFTTNVDGPDDSDVPLNITVDIDGVKVWYFPCGRRVLAANGSYANSKKKSPRGRDSYRGVVKFLDVFGRLSPSRFFRRLYYSPMMMDALKARVSEFDLVHLHSVFLWPTWAAARVARAANVPYVISPRGMLVKELIRRKSRMLKSLWLALIERQNIQQASAIHVTSQAESDELQKFGYTLPRVCSVPNGVEMPSQWSMDEVSEDVRTTIAAGDYVLYLGRINWKKGLDRLIKAWRDVPGAFLVIAGNDEEGYVDELKSIADASGVVSRIRFLSRSVKGADKEALFAKASLFVLPSYSENFGITVLEAMARSIPVVVTREVGASEVVVAANAGKVIDADDLADTISVMLADGQEMAAMGRRGCEWVEKYYTWDVVGARMVECYETISGKK